MINTYLRHACTSWCHACQPARQAARQPGQPRQAGQAASQGRHGRHGRQATVLAIQLLREAMLLLFEAFEVRIAKCCKQRYNCALQSIHTCVEAMLSNCVFVPAIYS